MDRRIRLRHLQVFVEIVRRGSLRGAAEALLLTQPAISRSLAELEEIIGARLLVRGRRGIALTARGEYLHGHALGGLAALAQGLAAEGAGWSEPVAVHVGALPSVAVRLMPRVAAILRQTAPQLRLHIADGAHGHLTALLRSGDLDAVIGRLGAPEAMQGISFTQLYLERVAVVVRPGHPILADPDLRRITAFPVVYPSAESAIRPLVENLLIAQGIPPPADRIETVSGAFGRVFVAQSDAVWFISAGVVAREIEDGRLISLPVDTALTAGPVGLMVRAAQPDTPARLLLRQAVTQASAEMTDSLHFP